MFGGTWNYRVLHSTETMVLGGEEVSEEVYAIHEVYYDKKGDPSSWSADPVPVHGETVAELQETLGRMIMATTKDVLELNELTDEALIRIARRTSGDD